MANKPTGLSKTDVAAIAGSGKKASGLQTEVSPVSGDAVYERVDQGVDYEQQTPYVAVGDGTVIGITHGFTGGTGIGVYYRLDKPVTVNGRSYQDLYVAEVTPLVQVGDRVKAGQAIASGGAAELGFANGTVPAAPLVGGLGSGTQPTQAGTDFLKLIKGGSVPASPAQKAATAAATAAAEAGNPQYVQNTTSLAVIKSQALAAAKATAHVSDPWVTVQTGKGGQVALGESTGATAPKDALQYGGQPVTKSQLSTIWNANYADAWESFTGTVPTAKDIVGVIQDGLSVNGLKSKLASQKTFTSSPAYKSSAPDYQAVAQQLLGKAAPQSLVKQALVNGWDQTAFAQAVKKLPAYLQGPDYQTNLGQNTTQYKQIYGNPDTTANQFLREATASGWTPDQVAAYLRAQPEYKTSLEYQTNAVGFLDALGAFVGGRPVLNPLTAAKTPTGGTAGPNSPLVPGAPATLGAPLPFQASLGKFTPAAPAADGSSPDATPEITPNAPAAVAAAAAADVRKKRV